MQYKYKLELRWSPEDGAWLVEVPELPGAMADGATPEEAIANAQETIRLWIKVAREDGRAVPAVGRHPRPHTGAKLSSPPDGCIRLIQRSRAFRNLEVG